MLYNLERQKSDDKIKPWTVVPFDFVLVVYINAVMEFKLIATCILSDSDEHVKISTFFIININTWKRIKAFYKPLIR